jgi:hypothetical protein
MEALGGYPVERLLLAPPRHTHEGGYPDEQLQCDSIQTGFPPEFILSVVEGRE